MNTDPKNTTRVPEAQRPSDINLRKSGEFASRPSDSVNGNEPQLRDNNESPLASQTCSTPRQCNDSHTSKLVTHASTPEQSVNESAHVNRQSLYEVTVARTDCLYTRIRVEAESEDEAENKAEELADLQPHAKWEVADRELFISQTDIVRKGGNANVIR